MESSASSSGFARFRDLVLTEPELFAQLQNAPTPDAFIALTVGLGAARGCAFTAGDVQMELNAARRSWLERNLP